MTSSRPLAAVLAVLGLSGLAALWLQARASAGMDFYQMWIGARMAREARGFYEPATRARMGEEYLRRAAAEEPTARRMAVARYRRDLEVLSTPFLYTIYAPMRGTYERDLLLFQALVFAAFVGWLALLAHTFRLGAALGLALFAFLANAFEPVASDARVVNMNHVLLLLVAGAAALTARRRFLAAGAVLALAALTKPYVLLIIPLTYALWIVRRRWRDLAAHAAGAALAGAAGILASSLYFRSAAIWLDWLRAFRDMPRAMVPLEIGNIAFARLIEDLFGFHAGAVLLVLAFAVTIVAGRRASSPRHTDLLAIGLGCVVFQFGSPLVWVHHLLLSVPLLLWLLRPAGEAEAPVSARRRQIAAAAALALLAVEPWARFVPTMLQVAALVNVGLLIAFIAALFDLAEGEPAA